MNISDKFTGKTISAIGVSLYLMGIFFTDGTKMLVEYEGGSYGLVVSLDEKESK